MRVAATVAALVVLVCTGCARVLDAQTPSVSHDGAQITGHVISDSGGQIESWVEYGPTTAYGSQTAHQTQAAGQNEVAVVNASLSGLARSTSYHWRLCAQDSQQQGGPGCSADQRFKTQSFACGETVTSNVRLTADVVCPGTALVLGSGAIDINLAGHRIRGPGTDDQLGTGIQIPGFDDVTIRNGEVSGWAYAVRGSGGSRTQVLRLRGGAVDLRGGSGHEIRHGDFSGLVALLVSGASRVVVADSALQSTCGGGIYLVADDSRVVRNAVGPGGSCSNVGLRVEGSRNQVADNNVSWSSGTALQVVGGSDNVVIENLASGLSFPDPQFGDGIRIEAATSGTLLRRNQSNQSSHNGITVLSPATSLGDNTTNDNGNLGIDAVAGVTDLGGNTASGNGNPLQCRDVFCAASP